MLRIRQWHAAVGSVYHARQIVRMIVDWIQAFFISRFQNLYRLACLDGRIAIGKPERSIVCERNTRIRQQKTK